MVTGRVSKDAASLSTKNKKRDKHLRSRERGRAGRRGPQVASHAERARLNVTRAIRAAIASLARANPSLGRHLSATIRTGRYCSYTPRPRAPIAREL
jgi:hypothetical protein